LFSGPVPNAKKYENKALFLVGMTRSKYMYVFFKKFDSLASGEKVELGVMLAIEEELYAHRVAMYEWLNNAHCTNRAPHKARRQDESSERPPEHRSTTRGREHDPRTRARPEDDHTRCGGAGTRHGEGGRQEASTREPRRREESSEHQASEKRSEDQATEHPPSQAHPYQHIHANFKVSCAQFARVCE
jgi:hypothetical protein